MTDILAERFAAIADTTSTGDWLDVRRRARRPRRHVALAITAAAAAVAAAAALAAGGGWLFTKHGVLTTGATQVQFHGKNYTLHALLLGQGRMFCLELSEGSRMRLPAIASGCGVSTLTIKGLPQRLLRPSAPTGLPFGAKNWDQGGGQVWFGDARPDVASIEIVDANGRTVRAQTAAPPTAKTAFRLWVIALPSSTGRTIAGYDAHGKLVLRRSIYGIGDLRLR
jgi:hypothetical protein